MERIRLLSREDIRQALDMPTAIARMGEAYTALSSDEPRYPYAGACPSLNTRAGPDYAGLVAAHRVGQC